MTVVLERVHPLRTRSAQRSLPLCGPSDTSGGTPVAWPSSRSRHRSHSCVSMRRFSASRWAVYPASVGRSKINLEGTAVLRYPLLYLNASAVVEVPLIGDIHPDFGGSGCRRLADQPSSADRHRYGRERRLNNSLVISMALAKVKLTWTHDRPSASTGDWPIWPFATIAHDIVSSPLDGNGDRMLAVIASAPGIPTDLRRLAKRSSDDTRGCRETVAAVGATVLKATASNGANRKGRIFKKSRQPPCSSADFCKKICQIQG
jgi:hypothetical protein